MAELTEQQIDDLWTNRYENIKCYNDLVTKDASTFVGLLFRSKLDSENYELISVSGVTHSSDLTTIETKVKSALATEEYKSSVAESSTNMG